MTWKEFKLIVTNPPANSNHFAIIKNELIPFVNNNPIRFWVTNYRDKTTDHILFRVNITTEQEQTISAFLNDLVTRRVIAGWQSTGTWEPRIDAQTRIENLRNRIPNYDPENQLISGVTTGLVVSPCTNGINQKATQLSALFESLGECTKILYNSLGTQPSDLWTMSVFLHLLINSLGFGGPDPPSQEYSIRQIPPL